MKPPQFAEAASLFSAGRFPQDQPVRRATSNPSSRVTRMAKG